MTRQLTTFAILAALAACSTPNPATVSAADVARNFDDARDLSTKPFTSTNNLPSDFVTYTGVLGADVTGDINGSIQGDMNMDVAFDAGTIGGSVRNINLIDSDGRPDQRLSGRLELDGFESAGRLDAFAFGDLRAVDDAGTERESDVLLTLEGDVVDDRGRGDAIFGGVRGSGIGALEFQADGVFYGRRE